MSLIDERRLRILVGMPHQNSKSGPLACEPQFVEELRRQGVEVDEEVYVFGDSNGQPNIIGRIRRVASTAFRFRKRLRQRSYDLVHFNTSGDRRALLRDAFTLWVLRHNQTPKFLKLHGSDASLLVRPDWLNGMALRQLLHRADAIGVLSAEERNNFIRAGAEGKKTFVVMNVVDPNVCVRSNRLHVKFGISPEVPILLFIGRFIPAKGLIDVIRACRIIFEKGVKFTLLCVGDGPDRPQAMRLVDEFKMQSCVRFCGFVSEEATVEYYSNSSLLVFPTYHDEGFPMVIFKSVAAGLPIITTRIRAAADYLSEPENCLWVDPRDPQMLADRLGRLLSDLPLATQMGVNNRQLAETFAGAKVANQYIEIYRNVIAPE